VKPKAIRRHRHMETSREQAVWSEQNAWERDSARSASFNAHYHALARRTRAALHHDHH